MQLNFGLLKFYIFYKNKINLAAFKVWLLGLLGLNNHLLILHLKKVIIILSNEEKSTVKRY
jgi:hypothetical protein